MIPRSFGDAWAAARRLLDHERPGGAPPRGSGEGGAEGGPSRLPASTERPTLDVVVFGTVAAGKSALVRALIGRVEGEREAVATSGAAGPKLVVIRGVEGTVRMTDTPGISGSGPAGAWDEAEALALAIRADLLLFVVDHDLLRAEFAALSALAGRGKRLVVALNKTDLFAAQDRQAILARVRERLAGLVPPEDVVSVAADPRPVTVRVRQLDGTEETVLEYEAPDLAELDERIEAILATEAESLRAGNLLLRAHLLRKAAREQVAREHRWRAEKIIEKYQWVAAAATVAIPIPQLDLMATGAVEYQMVSAIAAEYDTDLSPEHVRMISQQMIQALVKQRVAETVATLISKGLKSSVVGYAAGGLIGALTIAYLTRITGRTFLDYFEGGQEWGDGGMPGALARQIDRNGRAEFFKDFLRRSTGKLLGWVAGARQARTSPPADPA